MKNYENEARSRLGNTDAYREHEMYTCDARFKNNIDKCGDKTDEFTAEAIAVYCEKTKGE